ncbi:hypothetical protein AVEN_175038-1 [Araneus ventricosus]|uniref:NAA35-like TPR repeats domain-containing protein n=2 Tax=Araneus ventricosus TaxID=182803 RepID=A0A4Y2QLL5_ARAVE|nr:hypothetical protein AVEN_175038-1 [Araneus ventricosus]
MLRSDVQERVGLVVRCRGLQRAEGDPSENRTNHHHQNSIVTKIVRSMYGENRPTSRIMEYDALLSNIPGNTKRRDIEKTLEFLRFFILSPKWPPRSGIIGLHSPDFLNEFSKTSPCVLSRSVLQLLYLNQAKCSEPGKVLGTMHIVDVLRDAIKSFIKPPVLMPRY